MKKKIIGLALTGLFVCASALRTSAQEVTPFGICAHLLGGEEANHMPANLQMMHRAGIRWTRVDFVWSNIERPQGTWHFEGADRMVDKITGNGLNVLGLLLYNVAWANPAYKHIDAWLAYVEKTVVHYRDKVRFWEIWNEPNLFLDDPDGATYTILLEAAYKKIKEIDPDLTVVYGGTSGIPMEFFEKSFEAGAGAYCDILNIHPYRGRMTSVELSAGYQNDIDHLRKLMTKYGIGSKPIWVTEMGWSTWTPINASNKDAFLALKEKLAPGQKWKVGVMFDDNYTISRRYSEAEVRALLTDDFELEFIKIPDLKTKDLRRYDAMFFPPWEEYPVNRLWEELLPAFNYGSHGGRIYFYGDIAVTEDDQAIALPQAMLLSFRFGIDRYFWYEFEAPERNSFDREDRFGLVHNNLDPKPAYHAYATLSRYFPEGSKVDSSLTWKQKKCCLVSWTQPSGVRVWAIWSPAGLQTVSVKIGKGLQQACDYLGNTLPSVQETTRKLTVGPGITYLVGPQTFKVN